MVFDLPVLNVCLICCEAVFGVVILVEGKLFVVVICCF